MLDLGTAFARASVSEAGGGSGSITHSGFVDTDLRASYGVIPGKLLFNLVGTIPTGARAVADTTIPLFGATGTHLFGFTTPSFGSGGAVSAGFASAVKMGQNWAVGTGASYRYAARYVPVHCRLVATIARLCAEGKAGELLIDGRDLSSLLAIG